VFHPRHRLAVVLCGLMVVHLGTLRDSAAAGELATPKPIPAFRDVQRIVWQRFETRRDFEPNDLITRDDVAPLLKQLQQTGLPLLDAGKILEKVPAKGEFLVNQFSTPAGRDFMREIAEYSDGYDRVDRLSRMPHGEQTVRDLIRGPDGAKMIEYMTTTSGGKELGVQLSNAPTGKRFNTPTGRIYTVPMLLARLKQSHAAAVKAAGRSQTSP
jgi:hypothetical protein